MSLGGVFQVMWPYALQLGAAAFAVFLGKHLKTSADSARAQALATIARDVAAAVIANNPKLGYLQYVQDVVQALAATTGIPTTNTDVLKRAAIGALSGLGVRP